MNIHNRSLSGRVFCAPLPTGGFFDLLSLFLLPGELVCNWAGVPAESEHRQVLRSFINMMVWSALSIGATLWVML